MGRIVRTVLAGVVGGLIVLAAHAMGHGVQHALFAHDADKVDGLNANAIVRVGGASRSPDAPVAGSGAILTAQITAPRDGFLLIEATSDAYNFDTQLFPVCYLVVNDTLVDWSVRFIDLAFTVEDNCSTSAIGAVAKGTYTVSLNGEGDQFTNWGASNMNLLFSSFGPTGVLAGGASSPLVRDDAMTVGDLRRLQEERGMAKLSKIGADLPDRTSWVARREGPLQPLG